jgi:stage II sporulation protein AB (anti-sigma F factor)
METIKSRSGECLSNRSLKNEMKIEFDAVSENEAFARIAVSAFVTPLNPTMEEIADIKTAVSEAVTNAIIHGYDGNGKENGSKVYIHCLILNDILQVEVTDDGKGIPDIERAMEPLFTTRPDMDRSGMGFAFMEAFMDDLEVISEPGMGTTVLMSKKLGTEPWIAVKE